MELSTKNMLGLENNYRDIYSIKKRGTTVGIYLKFYRKQIRGNNYTMNNTKNAFTFYLFVAMSTRSIIVRNKITHLR